MATRSPPAGRTGRGAASPATSPARRRCTPARRRSASPTPAAWSGLQLGRNDAVDISGYDACAAGCTAAAPAASTVQIEVGNHAQRRLGRPSDIVPVAEHLDAARRARSTPLGTTQVTYMHWFNNTAGAQATFYVDDVAFVASGLPTPTPLGPVAGPALHVDAASGRHAISPLHLRHELRRRGAGRRAAPAGAALGRQRDDALQLAAPTPRTTPPTGTSRTFPTTTPTRRRCPTARAATSSSSRTGAPAPTTLLTVPLIGWTPHGRAYALRLQRRQVRRAAVDRSLAHRLRQRRAHQRQRDHRQRSRRHQRRDRPGRSCRHGCTTSSAATAPPPPAACASTTSTTSRCSGPTRTATSTRQPPSYDELRDRTLAYAAAIKAADPGRADARPGGVGLERLLLVGARLPRPAAPGGTTRRTAWRTATCRSSTGTCSRCAPTSSSTACASSTTSTCTTTRRRPACRCRRPATPRPRRCACARRARCGIRPTSTRAGSARPVQLIPRMRDWVTRRLPRHQARDQRVQLGRARPHQRRARAGRRARHLRPRGPRPRDAVGSADARASRARSPSACTATTTAPAAASATSRVAADLGRPGARSPSTPRSAAATAR